MKSTGRIVDKEREMGSSQSCAAAAAAGPAQSKPIYGPFTTRSQIIQLQLKQQVSQRCNVTQHNMLTFGPHF